MAEGKGAHFTDVDGHDYINFFLGDTGAMTGHAPDAIVGRQIVNSNRNTAQRQRSETRRLNA